MEIIRNTATITYVYEIKSDFVPTKLIRKRLFQDQNYTILILDFNNFLAPVQYHYVITMLHSYWVSHLKKTLILKNFNIESELYKYLLDYKQLSKFYIVNEEVF